MNKLIPLLLVAIFLASGCTNGNSPDYNTTVVDLERGPAQQFNPGAYVSDDWQLVNSVGRLSNFNQEIQTDLESQGIIDAATWEYSRGNESLYIWSRVYDSKETLQANDSPFTGMFAWIDSSELAFGDEGYVGIKRALNEAPPLMAYVAKDDSILFISYYNNITEEGVHYYNNASSYFDDKRFLVKLAKDILGNSSG